MIGETITYEVLKSSLGQRDWIKGRIGLLRVEVERLDGDTHNITIPIESEDVFTDWADEHDLEYRLI